MHLQRQQQKTRIFINESKHSDGSTAKRVCNGNVSVSVMCNDFQNTSKAKQIHEQRNNNMATTVNVY